MKSFTVTIGGETRTIPGPDDATQEQAQAEAERQMQASQSADLQKDLSGPGHLVAQAAQGGAELFGGPAQLFGFKPGPLFQQAENAPTTTGDKLARLAGAALPLGPLGAAATTKATPATIARGAGGRMRKIPGIPPLPGAALVPPAVGAVEGASAPADSQSQRAINTGLGAIGGKFGSMAPETASALDHLAGTALGGLMGHGAGGGFSGLASLWGARLGNQMSHYAPVVSYARQLLSRFPPSVVARMLSDAGYPVSKILGQEFDSMSRTPDGDDQRPAENQ
jgi:hypothetical protein